MALLDWVASLLPRGEIAAFDPRRYWEARHHELAGQLAAVGHRNLAEEANADQYRVKLAQIRSLIRRRVAPGEHRTLLEAGCGCGALTPHFLDLGFEVTAIDFSAKAITQAQRAAPQAQFKVASLSELDLGSQFDVVAVIDVLLHIVEESTWRSALAGLARHLAPNGVLLLLDSLRESPGCPEHCRTRPLSAYLEAFADLKLEIVEHVRFVLTHENAEKDLLAIRKRTAPG